MRACGPGGAEGKPLPAELRRQEAEVRREVDLEDDNTAVLRTHIDDEYAYAGEVDPQVRRPSLAASTARLAVTP